MVAQVKLPEQRTYRRQESITFRKTTEPFGGLSNMAGGYPLFVNGIKILTSEALYQACRFPHLPDVQQLIIAERSPMTAKMKTKPYRDNSRPDWEFVRTRVMRWCLQVKLVQNWDKFSQLLLETGDLPIVEDSWKDDFWGAKPQAGEMLVGINALGRLLMQLREQVKSGELTVQTIIKPLSLPNFLLYGQEINSISARSGYYPVSYTNLTDVKEDTSQLALEIMPSKISVNELELKPNNGLDKDNQIQEIQPEFEPKDAFQILLPYIAKSLQTERTDDELAKQFDLPLTVMRRWLKQAVELGKVRKLSKPIRYIAESQLSVLN
ncbi:MAG: NADAR family protein [Geitlerinemataceae cyanobacterium]